MTDFTTRSQHRQYLVAMTLLMLALLAVASWAGIGSAHDGHDHGNSAATPPGTPAASTGTGIVYLTITNIGSVPDRLTAVETDAAQEVSFHASGGGGDVMRMMEQPGGFRIPPGETLTLEPAGKHLMLENLNHDLRPGNTFAVTLTFDHAGVVVIDVTVAAEAPDGDVIQIGDLLLYPAWSLPAPRLGDGPGGTPEATPHHNH